MHSYMNSNFQSVNNSLNLSFFTLFNSSLFLFLVPSLFLYLPKSRNIDQSLSLSKPPSLDLFTPERQKGKKNYPLLLLLFICFHLQALRTSCNFMPSTLQYHLTSSVQRKIIRVKQKDITRTKKKISDKFSLYIVFIFTDIVLGIFMHLVNIRCSKIMTLCQTRPKYLSKLLSNLKNSGVDVSFWIHFCSSGFRMIISNFSRIFMHFNCSPTVVLCQTKPKYFTRLFISIYQ